MLDEGGEGEGDDALEDGGVLEEGTVIDNCGFGEDGVEIEDEGGEVLLDEVVGTGNALAG